MSLFYYIVISLILIMTLQFMVVKTSFFQLFQSFTLFVIGGIIGWALDSYMTGLVFALVMQMMFW